jgi:hypothetical protein
MRNCRWIEGDPLRRTPGLLYMNTSRAVYY